VSHNRTVPIRAIVPSVVEVRPRVPTKRIERRAGVCELVSLIVGGRRRMSK